MPLAHTLIIITILPGLFEETQLSDVLDWEFGRYSMLAYSFDYSSRNGLEFGATYWDAISKIIGSPFYLLGMGFDYVGNPAGSTVFVVGSDILGMVAT